MNRIQYRRWKDFARRMALEGWPARITHRKLYLEIVPPAVDHFFELLEHNYGEDITRIESWDNTRADYRNAKQFVWGFRGNYEPYVGSEAQRIIDEYWNPFTWSGRQRDFEKWDELWGGRIRCCVRAGLDLAAEPSAGVVGFTKGDLERMYPEGVPKWIRSPWGHQNGAWREIKWDDISPDDGLWM